MSFYFNKNYFSLALIFTIIEVCIALFVTDRIVRPFIGDVLVVILLYCCARILLRGDYRKFAFGALGFTCLIEILQYLDYVKLLGLENNRVLSAMLGRTFEWSDFAAYFTGFLIVLLCEKIYLNRNL